MRCQQSETQTSSDELKGMRASLLSVGVQDQGQIGLSHEHTV